MAVKLTAVANATLAAGTPAEGEYVRTTDTKKLYMGDGATQGGILIGPGEGTGNVSDGGTLTTGLTFPNTGLRLLDTNASHDLIVAPGSDLTADRTLTITTGDASRTLTLSADASVGGTNTGDQSAQAIATAIDADATAETTLVSALGISAKAPLASPTFTGTVTVGATTSVLLGTAGSAVGNVGFRNATSGTATLAPPTGALGTYTVTLPNATSTLPIATQQITFSGPTAARTYTLPDAASTLVSTDGTQTLTNKTIGAATLSGALDADGQEIARNLTRVVTSVTGSLVAGDHSGCVLVTSGNVTVPQTTGFNAILIAGGAHTVTFNGTTSAAMAAGDMMTVVVQSSTVIQASLLEAANKVAFT